MQLYETTRRRRIYKITIDWKNKNKRITITNTNPYRADIRRAEYNARLEKKYTTLEEYQKKKIEADEHIIENENKIAQNNQELNRYINKTVENQKLNEYTEQLNTYNTTKDNIKAQLDALDKKETSQIVTLVQQWQEADTQSTYYYNKRLEMLAIINDPNYYATNIKDLKAKNVQLQKDSKNWGLVAESYALESQTASDAFDKAKEALKRAEHLDVIRVTDKDQKGICGLRIDFTINKSNLGGSNETTIKIYNLREELRELLFQDYWIPGQDKVELKNLVLQAGYEGDGLNQIFKGDIRYCFSYLQGVDVITEIKGFDTSIDNQYKFEKTISKENMSRLDFIKNFLGSKLESGLTIGYIDTENLSDKPVQAPVIVSNKIINEMKKYAIDKKDYPMEVFIDNAKVNILSKNVGYMGSAKTLVISSETNLLETPKKYGTHILCKCLFMPKIEIGQIVSLYSEVEPAFNGKNLLGYQMSKDVAGKQFVTNTQLPPGYYKVISIKHNGSISDTEETKCVTELQLLTGGLILKGTSE